VVQSHRLPSAAVCLAALCLWLPSSIEAKAQRGKPNPVQDGIEVVAHLPLTSGPVTHFVRTKYHRRDYLYAESSGGRSVTLIDVTDVSRPAILSVQNSSWGNINLVTAAGTAALVAESSARTPEILTGKTFRTMSFADPQHLTVKQEFPNVSAYGRDEGRGLIFLANPQGVWILQEELASDPDFEREWEHMALDNR
jgi:hypothetical protein